MSTIPELRPRLLAIADRLPYASLQERIVLAVELRAIEAELYRRPYVRKARAKAVPMSPMLAKRIKRYAMTHPDMPMREIGFLHGVDGGRVSEAVAGKRR